MRTFNFGKVEVTAHTYLDADHKAEAAKLDSLVSDETFGKLVSMINRSSGTIEQHETIGRRDLCVILKVNDDDEVEGIHFSACKSGDDVCLLSDIQVQEGLQAANQHHMVKDLAMYDFDLENEI